MCVRSGEPLNMHSGMPLCSKRKAASRWSFDAARRSKAASRCTQSGKPLEVRSGKPQLKAVNRCTQSGKPLQVRSGTPLNYPKRHAAEHAGRQAASYINV